MNQKLTRLNEGRASLIILKVLHEKGKLDKQTLAFEVRKLGPGRTSFESSLRICQELGLVKVELERIHPKGQASLMHHLTEKGRRVAEIVAELEKALKEGGF